MKKILASLLAFLGSSGSVSADQKPQSMDPRRILFSVPTISNDLAPLDKVKTTPSATDFTFHEDDWTQVEFLPRSQLHVVERMLQQYKTFEAANRAQYGWRETYLRRFERIDVIHGTEALKQLQTILGVKAGPAPVLFSSNAVTGRVTNGFSLPFGRSVTLYGYTNVGSILVLGALVGPNPGDTKLVEAFQKLNAKEGLILVDWRQQLVLVSIASDGKIDAWRP